jgi:ClpP class serine protease
MRNRFIDTPLVLHPPVARELLDVIMIREDEPKSAAVSVTTACPPERSFELINGVALIPITGVLTNGESIWWDETSYGSIATRFNAALADADARAIALQIASPGGEVSGFFDLAEMIYSSRGSKPIWAILDDHAYSAAYGLASAADRITVPVTGGTGSVGAVAIHVDMSAALEKYGIKTTIVQYGARKTDYSPFKPLADDARERLQADIDAVGEMFVEMVGRNRGLASAKVRATEASIFMGAAGVEQGFADTVAAPHLAFKQLSASIGGNS